MSRLLDNNDSSNLYIFTTISKFTSYGQEECLVDCRDILIGANGKELMPVIDNLNFQDVNTADKELKPSDE